MSTKENTTLILCDLTSDIILTDIENFLSGYKEQIESIEPQHNKAIVKFKDKQSAHDCRIKMDQKKIKNRTIRIMWEEKDFLQNNKDKKIYLYIKSVPQYKTPREIFEYFIKFGEIFSFKINEDNQVNNNTMTAFVTYYNENDAKKAMDETNGKKIWNSNMEVQYKKNSEKNYYHHDNNLKINISNLPDSFTEKDIEKLCEEFGKIQIFNFNQNQKGKSAIVKFSNESQVKKACEKLNKKEIDNKKINVKEMRDNHYNKNIYQQNNVYNLNYNLSYNFPQSMMIYENPENSTLYVRNIPYTVTEDELRKVFGQYGKIVSIKLDDDNTQVKSDENEEVKKKVYNKGFGYISFEKIEEAKLALNKLNGKYLVGFESWSKPLIVDYYVPKEKRQQNFYPHFFNLYNGQFPYNPEMFQYPVLPFQMQYPNQFKQNMMNQGNYKNYGRKNRGRGGHRGVYHKNSYQKEKNIKKFDYEGYKQCKTPEEKKDFLGDKVFNAIQQSQLIPKKDEEKIANITGMIIDIPNEKEIIEILENPKSLEGRIKEALELLNKTNDK